MVKYSEVDFVRFFVDELKNMGSTGCKKRTGALTVGILKQMLKDEFGALGIQLMISEPNSYVKGSSNEIDLLVLKPNAKSISQFVNVLSPTMYMQSLRLRLVEQLIRRVLKFMTISFKPFLVQA